MLATCDSPMIIQLPLCQDWCPYTLCYENKCNQSLLICQQLEAARAWCLSATLGQRISGLHGTRSCATKLESFSTLVIPYWLVSLADFMQCHCRRLPWDGKPGVMAPAGLEDVHVHKRVQVWQPRINLGLLDGQQDGSQRPARPALLCMWPWPLDAHMHI